MTHRDRDRLVVSLVLSLVVHGAIVGALAGANWRIEPYPQASPVFVELPEYRSSPAAPEPEPTPVPAPLESKPEPEPEPPKETGAAEVPPPQPGGSGEPAAQPPVTPAAPGQSSSTAPAPAPDGSDTPFTRQEQAQLGREVGAARDRPRPAEPDLFAASEPFADTEVARTGELPAWVTEGTVQPLSSLPASDQERLRRKDDTMPGFAERLDAILAQATAPTADSTPGSTAETSSTPVEQEALPGGSELQWEGGGSRRALDAPLPGLGGEDFGGLVPTRLVYVIIFDVNADGLVVPGSLILRQSSGYTAADQKVVRTISGWRFEPSPGSSPVTAIATLIIEREAVQ